MDVWAVLFCLSLSASASLGLSDFGSALYASVFGGSLSCQITEDLSQIAHILKPRPERDGADVEIGSR